MQHVKVRGKIRYLITMQNTQLKTEVDFFNNNKKVLEFNGPVEYFKNILHKEIYYKMHGKVNYLTNKEHDGKTIYM